MGILHSGTSSGLPLGNFGNMAGRPTKYQDAYSEQAFKLCLLGATDVELADFFEVTESTINEWKLAHAEFSESIKKGKFQADAEVANKLYTRANGYKYDEVTYEKVDVKIDGIVEEDDIKMEPFKKKVVTKEVAPDVTAQIFWLKNRSKKKWRDKVENGFTDNDGNDRYADLSEDKLDEKIQALIKRRDK
jgi:hypothetical protein